MYIIRSNYGTYIKNINDDTTDIKQAKIFDDEKTAYNYKNSYATHNYDIIKIKKGDLK